MGPPGKSPDVSVFNESKAGLHKMNLIHPWAIHPLVDLGRGGRTA